jgi:hypothetical protein
MRNSAPITVLSSVAHLSLTNNADSTTMFNERASEASQAIFGPEAVRLTRVGLLVYDRQSNQIGRVAEVSRVAFRVEVTWDPDFWLGYDLIDTVLPGQYLQLIITADQLDKFTIPPSVAAA